MPTRAKNLIDLKSQITLIEEKLPSSIDPAKMSLETKIPFKVLSLRELLMHRISELSLLAYDFFEDEKAIPGLIYTRAVLEATAVFFTLKEKMEITIEQENLNEFDDHISKMLLGSRNEITEIETFNVLTAIDKWDSRGNYIKKVYDDLSEFVHPNWSGLLMSYGKLDKETLILLLGSEHRRGEFPLDLGINSLLAVLVDFINFYDAVGDILPDFIKLCETFFNSDSN